MPLCCQLIGDQPLETQYLLYQKCQTYVSDNQL